MSYMNISKCTQVAGVDCEGTPYNEKERERCVCEGGLMSKEMRGESKLVRGNTLIILLLIISTLYKIWYQIWYN